MPLLRSCGSGASRWSRPVTEDTVLVMKPLRLLACALPGLVLALPSTQALDSPLPADVASALERAGDNRLQLLAALEKAPATERSALEFLIANLPDRDL